MLLNTWDVLNSWIEPAVSTAKGGYVPPVYVKSKLKKKDRSILENVLDAVARIEETLESEPSAALQKRVEGVEKRATKFLYIESETEKRREIRNLQQQVKRLELAVKAHAKHVEEDESEAIELIMMIM